MIFDLGLYLACNFCLLGKYFLYNEVVSDTEASSFPLMEIQSFWLVLQMKQKLFLMWFEHLYQNTVKCSFRIWWEKHMSSQNVCLPRVKKWSTDFSSRCHWEKLQALRGMSHSLTQMPIPVAGIGGFQPHSKPERLYFSTGQLQSRAPFAQKSMSSNKNSTRKLNTSIKNVSCVPVSSHCVSARWQEAMRKTEWVRLKREKSKNCRT